MASMPFELDNWQRNMTDSASTMKYLFDSREPSLCDASFDVLDENGTSEVIHVHRIFLAMRSSVFAAMFYGPMANKTMPIEIDDITPRIFKTMLQYIYKDDVKCVDQSNVLAVFYVAHKYDIESLRDLCSKTAAKTLTVESVFPSLRQGDLFEAQSLLNACYELIDTYTTKALGSSQFKDQPVKVVKTILTRTTLAADGMPEKCVYKAVLRWALAEADRQKVSGSSPGARVRATLGSLLYLIRFPLMEPGDIVEAKQEGILSAEESADLLAILHKVPGVASRFVASPRSGREKALANVSGAHNVQKQCGACRGTGQTRTGPSRYQHDVCTFCKGQGYIISPATPPVYCEFCRSDHMMRGDHTVRPHAVVGLF